jgi:hypothetical protein
MGFLQGLSTAHKENIVSVVFLLLLADLLPQK